jgi:hypothetical protein
VYERETKFYLRRVTVILIITCDTKKRKYGRKKGKKTEKKF